MDGLRTAQETFAILVLRNSILRIRPIWILFRWEIKNGERLNIPQKSNRHFDVNMHHRILVHQLRRTMAPTALDPNEDTTVVLLLLKSTAKVASLGEEPAFESFNRRSNATSSVRCRPCRRRWSTRIPSVRPYPLKCGSPVTPCRRCIPMMNPSRSIGFSSSTSLHIREVLGLIPDNFTIFSRITR